eukprot:UN34786
MEQIKNPHSLFNSWFYMFDVAIVFLSLALVGVPNTTVATVVRSCRVFRLIGRISRISWVVEALCLLGGAVLNTIVFVFFFWFILAVLGMNLYANKMSFCDEPLEDGEYYSPLGRTECEAAGYVWRQKEFNFDRFIQAMHSIFYLSGMSSWVDVMYQGG